MPYISARMTTPLTAEKEAALTAAFGKDIEVFPGKTERWLMVDFTGDCRMHFAGTDEPCAMVEVALFGKGNPASFDKMTDLVCRAMEEICGIAPDHCYVKYEEVSHWGWNGQNF